jgi:nucleoside-diphosphate-sugar epimerase
MSRILVTGSEGLIGVPLCRALQVAGHEVAGFDLRAAGAAFGDVRDAVALRGALAGCDGVVHLAAVSRVMEAEANPAECWATNVDGLRNLLEAAAGQVPSPWVIFGSSREVYGNPAVLPADEDTPPLPLNRYAASKLAGEELVAAAAAAGARAMIARFSNVYGSATDYADRVVPAFALAAARGGRLWVHGRDHRLDFTHIEDLTRGLVALVACFGVARAAVPTLHFVTGRGTSLGELAELSCALSERVCEIVYAPETGLHASNFVGCGARAREHLGWEPRIGIEDGLKRLIDSYAALGSDRDNALKGMTFGAKLPAKSALDARFSPEIWPLSGEIGKGRTA